MNTAIKNQGGFAADALLILRYGVFARSPRIVKFVGGLAVLVALILFGIIVYQGISWTIADILHMVAIEMTLIYLFGWNVFVSTVAMLCGPSQSRLVPRVRQRVIVLTLLSWSIGVALCTLVFGGGSTPYAYAAAAAGLYSISMAMLPTRSPFAFLLLFASYTIYISKDISASAQALLSGWSGLVIVLVAAPVLLWIFVQVMFPLSADRAWRVARQIECGERASRQPFGDSATIGFWARSVYAVSLKRTIRGTSAPAQLLIHVLGVRLHWSDLLWVPALVFLIAAPVRIWLEIWPDAGLQDALGTVSAIPFVILVIMNQLLRAWMPVARAGATLAEQGLYRLTPRSPGGINFNRIFAASIVRAGFASWFLMTVSILCASWLLWTPWRVLALQACACAMALPLLAIPLLDYSSQRILGKWWRNVWTTLACVGVTVALYLEFDVAKDLEQSLRWALAYLAAALVLLLVRRHTMLAAPVAFPAERIGA